MDFFSGYDGVELAVQCRDLTAFMTPLGLLRQTQLPMGATNSVAQFVRIVTRILQDHIPHIACQFVDDVGVKGPKTTYDNAEVFLGVRRYVMEHIQNLDVVLADIKQAGATVSGEKSQFCMRSLKVVGFVCDINGRHLDAAKVIKIVDWPDLVDTTGARAFLGVCVYYRIWVEGFAKIAEPIYRVLKKGVDFVWGPNQADAMHALKHALVSPPALVSIDYAEGAGLIVLGVDASLEGWGATLMQINNGKRHPARYESGIWSLQEKVYDATKRECRGVLKALKKVRNYL